MMQHICPPPSEEVQKKFHEAASGETLDYVADTFKVLGDRTRVRILAALLTGEKNVCTIAALLAMTHSAVSHQLAVLKQARLVRYEKQGKNVIYALNDEHIVSILSMAIDHINE